MYDQYDLMHSYNNRVFDQLEELLSASDYVCSVLPSTPETIGLLDADAFKSCAKKVSKSLVPRITIGCIDRNLSLLTLEEVMLFRRA